MDEIMDFVLLVLIIVCYAVWIVSLAKYDGKCPCEPKDCKNCVYSGTGCKTDPKTKGEDCND